MCKNTACVIAFASLWMVVCGSGTGNAVPYTGDYVALHGVANWPNPHNYHHFVSQGELCSSTHFTCERPVPEQNQILVSSDILDQRLCDQIGSQTNAGVGGSAQLVQVSAGGQAFSGSNVANPHNYHHFISQGEACSSGHFTCERPKSEPAQIQTASATRELDHRLCDQHGWQSYDANADSGRSNIGPKLVGGETAVADAGGGNPSFNDPGVGPLTGAPSPATKTKGTDIPVVVSPVPLPSSAWLFLSVLFGYGLMSFRIRKTA